MFAQDTATSPPSQFDKLFPNPTGTNGYEELIRAADRLRGAKAAYLPANEFTLAKKRVYVSDPACQEALTLIRRGASKTMQLPDANGSPPFLLFAAFRSLFRLLAVQVVVQFADGANEIAVRTLSDSLKISATFKAQSLIALIVGNSIDTVVLTPFAQLKEVWTQRDCSRIIAIAKRQSALPDPAYSAIEAERADSLRLLAAWRTDTKALTDTITQDYTLNGPSGIQEKGQVDQAKSREYAAILQNDSAVRERVLGELSSLIQEHYDRAFALVKDPTKRMQLTPPPEADANRHPITIALRSSFLLEAQSTLRRGVENRLALQLVAVHAAIRSYRWEYDRLPAALTDIDIAASFLRDPFTSKSLLYTPNADGTTYRLASAGALMMNDKGVESREPFTFPHDSAKPA